MKPLKCYAWKAWCLWNGHEPVPGVRYVYGEAMLCICCKHCHKYLG